MNKNIRKVKDAGITLIALVVTIIVLLILAAVTVNIALGNDGLISRTKTAREEKIIGDEKEALSLAYTAVNFDRVSGNNSSPITSGELQQELTNEGYRTQVTGTGTLRVKFLDTKHIYMVNAYGNIQSSTPVAYTSDNSNVIDFKVMYVETDNGDNSFSYINYIYVLKESNNLYRYKYTSDIGTIDPSDLEFVASDVAKIENNFYLTTDSSLYNLDGYLLANNVKEYNRDRYLTNNNELHYMWEIEEAIGENVKNYTYECYLTDNNDLYTYSYTYNDSTPIMTRNKVLTNVREMLDNNTIITNSNELYKLNGSGVEKERDNVLLANYSYYVGTDNKLYKRSNNNVVGTDVAKLGGDFYLTNSNKLQDIWNNNVNAQNVRSFEEFGLGGARFCSYKTLDNQEFYIRGIASPVSMPDYDTFIEGYYTKNNKLYCLKNGDTVLQNNVVNFGTINSSSFNYWCQLQNKKIYYDIQVRES